MQLSKQSLVTAIHLKNIQNSLRQFIQSEFLFIRDNVYNDYRTVFLSFDSSMDENI